MFYQLSRSQGELSLYGYVCVAVRDVTATHVDKVELALI